MKNGIESFWKRTNPAARATLWALFLFTPIVYYQLHRRPWSILTSIMVGLIPLASLPFHFLLFHRKGHKRDALVGPIAANFLVIALLTSTLVCLLDLPWHTAILNSIMWGMTGIGVGIIWQLWRMTWTSHDSQNQSSRRDQSLNGFLIIWILWTIYQCVRQVQSIGPAGLIVGPAMIMGVYLGFMASYLVQHIWETWNKVWEELVKYIWPLATFVSGYFIIVYVFAGLSAMLWRSNPDHFKPSSNMFHFTDFLYYSISTVSTLGYSDIRPVSLAAKVITSIEFMVGIFWITAVFALLISQVQKNQFASEAVPEKPAEARKAASQG